MISSEQVLKTKVSKAKEAADKFETATATYALFSYIGAGITAAVGIFSGWNWLLIGYAGTAALVTWFVQSFALMQNAKLELAAAVAEAESSHRNSTGE